MNQPNLTLNNLITVLLQSIALLLGNHRLPAVFPTVTFITIRCFDSLTYGILSEFRHSLTICKVSIKFINLSLSTDFDIAVSETRRSWSRYIYFVA